jgi:hypothetical protein
MLPSDRIPIELEVLVPHVVSIPGYERYRNLLDPLPSTRSKSNEGVRIRALEAKVETLMKKVAELEYNNSALATKVASLSSVQKWRSSSSPTNGTPITPTAHRLQIRIPARRARQSPVPPAHTSGPSTMSLRDSEDALPIIDSPADTNWLPSGRGPSSSGLPQITSPRYFQTVPMMDAAADIDLPPRGDSPLPGELPHINTQSPLASGRLPWRLPQKTTIPEFTFNSPTRPAKGPLRLSFENALAGYPRPDMRSASDTKLSPRKRIFSPLHDINKYIDGTVIPEFMDTSPPRKRPSNAKPGHGVSDEIFAEMMNAAEAAVHSLTNALEEHRMAELITYPQGREADHGTAVPLMGNTVSAAEGTSAVEGRSGSRPSHEMSRAAVTAVGTAAEVDQWAVMQPTAPATAEVNRIAAAEVWEQSAEPEIAEVNSTAAAAVAQAAVAQGNMIVSEVADATLPPDDGELIDGLAVTIAPQSTTVVDISLPLLHPPIAAITDYASDDMDESD